MKFIKMKNTSIKRLLRYWKLRMYYSISTDKRSKYPSKMSDSEKVATSIFVSTLINPESKLYYDVQTRECYLRTEDGSLFIFLESRNIKIINSVYGYDVHISSELENYLSERFVREMNKRRSAFKQEALDKVEHSLENTLLKLKTQC